jgi:hypothetical protein
MSRITPSQEQPVFPLSTRPAEIILTLCPEEQAMASNGKAATGTVFLESFVLHENSSNLEVQLRRMETTLPGAHLR